MVFARAKLVLEDNCFEEEPSTMTIKLEGPHVQRMYKVAYEMIKSVFNVTDSDVQETQVKISKTEHGDKYDVVWWLHKDMDVFSYFYISFKFKAQGDLKSGSLTMAVKGLLRSEYPQDTVWQRSLIYEMLRTFWHRLFYHKKREDYAEECRHAMVIYQRKFVEYFNRLKEVAPAAGGHSGNPEH
ncbi:MAG: hypothetical protein HY369_00685 [Candidatus Aenigmarchaeota archaeon]|nr:hypothetical protein [Candidatus Aenigmarchaeota archaeon]